MGDNQQPSQNIRVRAFGALRHRDFRLLWFGMCLSFVGSWVQMVALGLLVYHSTGSREALGIVGLAGGLPTTVLMLFGGAIADRSNRKRLVIGTQTIFGLNAFALAAMAWTGRIHVWQVAIVAFISGVVFAIDGPARQSMVYDLVGEADLAGGIALQSIAFNMARVIGPAIASITYAVAGPSWCFILNGISYAAVITALILVRTDLSIKNSSSGTMWSGFIEGIQHLKSNRAMGTISILTASTTLLAFSVYSTLMPAFAHEELGISERDSRYGYLFSAIGLGSLAGAALVGRFAAANKRGQLMLVGANLFALALIAISTTRQFLVALPLFGLVGFAAIAQLATANTLTQSLAPDSLRARAVSIHMFAMSGLQPFGAFIAGAAAQRYGDSMTVGVAACLLLCITVGVSISQKSIWRLK